MQNFSLSKNLRSMVLPPLLPLRQCRRCCRVQTKMGANFVESSTSPYSNTQYNKFLSAFGRNGTMKSFRRVFQFSLPFYIHVNYTQLKYAIFFRNTFNSSCCVENVHIVVILLLVIYLPNLNGFQHGKKLKK
jgi:hypothetical protein